MVLTTDYGHSPRCQYCDGLIKNHENGGIVHTPEGNLSHTSCYREIHGNESAAEPKSGWDTVKEWANFDRRPPGKYGARRIA